MTSFPTGAIEKLPWGSLMPDVVRPADTVVTSTGGPAGSPRRKWSAADVWRRMEQNQIDQHARVRYLRAPVCTPPLPDAQASVIERHKRKETPIVLPEAPVDTSTLSALWDPFDEISEVLQSSPISCSASSYEPTAVAEPIAGPRRTPSPSRSVVRRAANGDWETGSAKHSAADYNWFLEPAPNVSERIPGFEDRYFSHRQIYDRYVNARIQHL